MLCLSQQGGCPSLSEESIPGKDGSLIESRCELSHNIALHGERCSSGEIDGIDSSPCRKAIAAAAVILVNKDAQIAPIIVGVLAGLAA